MKETILANFICMEKNPTLPKLQYSIKKKENIGKNFHLNKSMHLLNIQMTCMMYKMILKFTIIRKIKKILIVLDEMITQNVGLFKKLFICRRISKETRAVLVVDINFH